MCTFHVCIFQCYLYNVIAKNNKIVSFSLNSVLLFTEMVDNVLQTRKGSHLSTLANVNRIVSRVNRFKGFVNLLIFILMRCSIVWYANRIYLVP